MRDFGHPTVGTADRITCAYQTGAEAKQDFPEWLWRCFPPALCEAIRQTGLPFAALEEICLRAGGAVSLTCAGQTRFLPITLARDSLDGVLLALCGGSLYPHREEICNGYLLLRDGIRVGVAGRADCEGERVRGVYEMSVAVQACEAKPEAGKKRKWISRIGKRQVLIAGAVLLIGAAVWLNWAFFAKGEQKGYKNYSAAGKQGSTDQTDVGTGSGNQETDAAKEDSYFSTVQVSRRKARDEALEVFQSVVGTADEDDAASTARTEALAEIKEIADEIQKEAAIESLLLSKGFEQCVVVLNGDTASVIVKSGADGFGLPQLSQINAVVYDQTGIEPVNITIIEKK